MRHKDSKTNRIKTTKKISKGEEKVFFYSFVSFDDGAVDVPQKGHHLFHAVYDLDLYIGQG